MSTMPSDAIAYRREFAIGVVTFLVSFFGIAGVIIYLHARYVIPESGTWGIVQCIRDLVEWPLFGAFFLGFAAVYVVRRWGYWRGMYHCIFCGRALHYKVSCPCRPIETSKTRGLSWARCGRYVATVLVIDIALVPIAMGLARLTKHPRPHPAVQDIAIAHAILCVALLIGIRLTLDILELFKRGPPCVSDFGPIS